ncbi:MAG: MarR family transcriptional regulator [Candidatus Bathycorpusculaceae bacterium]
MEYKSRFDKEAKVQQVMLEILNKKPNGMQSKQFLEEVEKKTGVSRGMIFDLIRKLASLGLLTIKRDSRDRRRAIYEVVKEKAEPQIKRYATVMSLEAFLKSFENPQFKEDTQTIGNYKASLRLCFEGVEKKLLANVDVESMLKVVAPFFETLLINVKAEKVALVLTAEEK